MAEKKANKDNAGAEKPKGKPPILVIIVVVVLISLVGGLVAVKRVSAKGKVKHVEHGPVMTLDEFLVNLADPGGERFLKVTVSLELDKEKGKTAETLKEQIAPIRDSILMLLMTKTRDQIGSDAGREKLKTEIKKHVNTALGEDDVQDVYFTNYVTQ